MIRARRVAVIAGLASLALAGCGGGREAVAPHRLRGVVFPIRLWGTPPKVMVALALEGHAYYFILDTGAARTFIKVGIARKLGLRDDGAPREFAPLGCVVFAQPVALRSWRLGNASLPARTVFTQRLLLPHAFEGVPVGGLLGADFLSSYGTVMIDFTHRKLILGGRIPTGRRADRIDILRRAGAVDVTTQVEVDDHRARFIVDTGAPISVIDGAAAARLGLRAVGPTRRAEGAVCRASITPVFVREWQIGSVRVRRAVIGRVRQLVPEGHLGAIAVGLVGTATLARLGTLTIDFAHSRMLLGGRIQ